MVNWDAKTIDFLYEKWYQFRGYSKIIMLMGPLARCRVSFGTMKSGLCETQNVLDNNKALLGFLGKVRIKE